MGRSFGLIAVIVVAGLGAYIYTKQVQSVTPGGTGPQATIDATAVRNDLLALANAERQYFATNGKYASLDELHSDGGIEIPRRANYTYSAEVSGAGFEIVAAYSGSDSTASMRLTIDETMAIKSE